MLLIDKTYPFFDSIMKKFTVKIFYIYENL